MNEAQIFYIHFGYLNECGRGGDYRMWLDEQKYKSSRHKYCKGTPMSIENTDPDGVWIQGNFDEFNRIEIQIDLISGIKQLTKLQKFCFKEVVIRKRTQESVAIEINKSRANIQYAIDAAKKNLKKYFHTP